MQGASVDTKFGQTKLTESEKKILTQKYGDRFGQDLLKLSEHFGVCLAEDDYLGIVFLIEALGVLITQAADLMTEKKASMVN